MRDICVMCLLDIMMFLKENEYEKTSLGFLGGCFLFSKPEAAGQKNGICKNKFV